MHIDTWNKYQKQFKVDLLNRQPDIEITNRKLFEILLREITFQHTILSSLLFPSLHFFFFFLFTPFFFLLCLVPYSYSQPPINLSPFLMTTKCLQILPFWSCNCNSLFVLKEFNSTQLKEFQGQVAAFQSVAQLLVAPTDT